MTFPAAVLRHQINLQCLDATQIPSGSRKSHQQNSGKKRTSSKFWVQEPSAEAESVRILPEVAQGMWGSFRKRRSGLIFKLNFCRAPCQVCSIPAWITPGFVCLQLHSIKILTVRKESLPSPSLAGEIHFLFTGKMNHFLKVGTFPSDSQK